MVPCFTCFELLLAFPLGDATQPWCNTDVHSRLLMAYLKESKDLSLEKVEEAGTVRCQIKGAMGIYTESQACLGMRSYG